MRTHLRLHKDSPVPAAVEGPATFRFPAAMAEARRTLVAGVVSVPAVPGPPTRAWHSRRTGVLAHIDGGVETSSETDRLLRDVERTLDAMQDKLDSIKEDAEVVFKFPPSSDDDRPRAA